MILETQRNLNQSEHIEVYLDQELVQLVKKQNLLGVIIDETLSWDDQVEMVCLNITRRITLLKLLSKYIDKINMNQHYNSYSILFYHITLEGRRGTTDEFATIPFHLDLFSAALVELAKSIPVHSLILSSHLFFCLPLFLFPFTVPCKIVFAKPEDLETWPNHLSFRFLTRVRRSTFTPMAAWIFLRTFSLVTWSLYKMFNSLR